MWDNIEVRLILLALKMDEGMQNAGNFLKLQMARDSPPKPLKSTQFFIYMLEFSSPE